MPVQVNTHEAKTNLSKLLARVKSGEEIIIANAGRPVARLVPIEHRPLHRTPGSAQGRINIAPDFDAELPEAVLKTFEE